MAQLITVRLNKSDQQPLGFRLQGGKDFGTPLVVQKVNGGSAAERAGLQAGDALIRVNTTDVYTLRHQEAQDAIRAGGGNLELTVQRGGGTWRPSVTPTGSLPRPGSRPLGASPAPVTNTSLKATPQPSRAFGSGHNNVAKPFGYMNGNDSVKSIVNKQYNSPVSMYSDKTIAETLSAQTEVLAGGVLGVNFKKNEKTYDSEKSAVFKVLQEAENDPEPVSEATPPAPTGVTPGSGLRHVTAPVTRDPPLNTGGLPPGQNICEDCERLITGVFVRIKDKNLHVECFKCATCGSSLKNQGYYNMNGKLYCDIHAKLVAKQNPPAPNLDPVTVPPGGRLPTNAYSTPLPPLSTNNYTNGSSSMFSPSSNLSGPKPFGSSLGTYSPASLSPRSAPLSPRAPPPALAPAPAPAPHHTFAPTKNVKSIVWPPPNPPEDEPESETNPKILNSDLTSEQRNCSTIKTSNVSDTQINSTEQIDPRLTQTMEFSSNASYDSTQMASSTMKSQTAIQKQRSEVKQEISSCTVQSYSQQASESEQFSVYQSHIASDELNKKIQNMERQVRQEQSANVLPSKFKTGENIPQYSMQNPNVNVSNIKTPPYSEKPNSQKIPMPMSTKVSKPGTRVPVGKKPFNVRPQASGTSGSNPPPKKSTLQRGSLLEALTIAPDRPYSPLSFHLPSMQYSNLNAEQGQVETSLVSEVAPPCAAPSAPPCVAPCAAPCAPKSEPPCAPPCAPPSAPPSVPPSAPPCAPPTYSQSSVNQSIQSHTEQCNKQNTGILQMSSQMSAFKPVCKQTFPPPRPEEFSSQVNYPADVDNQNASYKEFSQSNKETVQESKLSESMAVTSINTTQNYIEQLDKQESSAFARTESSLHKPDSIPPYQQAIVSEAYNPGLLQKSYTPTNVTNKVTNKTSLNIKNKDISESMTFLPVVDETSLRISPARSRPTTPSMINKPAPIIPHYQMNLVTMEHLAPESRLYNPSSTDVSRSSTPLLRSRSPAPQQQSNIFKAQAPRIKPMTPQSSLQQAQFQNTQFSNYNKEHDLSETQASNPPSLSGVQNYIPNQPLVLKDESQSNIEYRAENYNKGDMNIREDSMLNQNYGERQTESQNISQYGNTTVQTTKKTFEEFESARSAKVIEIRKGSLSSGSNQQIESNIQPINNNLKQVFPPPISTMTPPQQTLLDTNDSVVNASKRPQIYQPTPFISGANQGPVCDPTPSTGSSVGAAARGKTFGVSSAPKRGRGVLNKAALPGSRVPLCGSCNGNIRGPFITALGRIWCPEHFVCVNATCRRQLQDIGFVEENGQLYCEFCFEQYIAPPCDKCHNKIKEDCLNAIGKHFHPECFSCVYCGKLFGNNPFFLEDGLPYCEADWNELFTTKCFACGFPVEAGDRWVEALNNNYHSQCFNCTVCKKNLQGQSFFAKGGRPFCKSHAR